MCSSHAVSTGEKPMFAKLENNAATLTTTKTALHGLDVLLDGLDIVAG